MARDRFGGVEPFRLSGSSSLGAQRRAGVDVKRPVAESHLVAVFSAAEIGVTDMFVRQSVNSMCLSKTMMPFSLRTMLHP
jgi:hypothetical protein